MSASAAAADWPEARLGPRAAWDSAHNAATGERFIPFQLLVPGIWHGERSIELPEAANFTDGGGSSWKGPVAETDAVTGAALRAYIHERTTNREGTVKQLLAVRAEKDGIGRVYDSRFGEIRCSGELKFPLGNWRQDERMSNHYTCINKRGATSRRQNLIVIERIDFPCHGVPHCLQYTWTHWVEGKEKPADDRRYVLAPGLGVVEHQRR